MTWRFIVILACGHRNRGEAKDTPKPGDPWHCHVCGADTTITSEMGHGV